jgi:hypothetical protein
MDTISHGQVQHSFPQWLPSSSYKGVVGGIAKNDVQHLPVRGVQRVLPQMQLTNLNGKETVGVVGAGEANHFMQRTGRHVPRARRHALGVGARFNRKHTRVEPEVDCLCVVSKVSPHHRALLIVGDVDLADVAERLLIL